MQILYLSSKAHSESFGSLLTKLLDNDQDKVEYIIPRITHIADNGGHPLPPTAKRLKGVELCELRMTYDKDNDLRIYYFVDQVNNVMVLLNTIIKPDGYNHSSKYQKQARKQIDKMIDESIKIALTLKAEYTYPNQYYESF